MGDGKPYGKDARTLGPEEVVETFKAKERPSGLSPRPTPEATPGPETRARIGRAETLPPPPGEQPGPRYAFVRELGRGGMGRVDEVFDSELGRAVAQKTVISAMHATLLVAEAQTCAQLEHPAIVPVYDLGAGPEGQPYYTMREVRGRTLREVLGDNADPAKERKTLVQMLNVLRQVCLAVDYAHSRGVVHRDLKPENVIVGEFGEVYVLDWGIAHVMDGSDVRRARLSEYVAGSPGYMAPEQAAGGPIDGRTDVYALGAILYELLTGKVPFEDPRFRVAEGRLRAVHEAPPSLRNPGLSSSFDTLVASCLEPNPDDRLPTARFVADAIDIYLDGERERTQRETEAGRYTAEGEAARDAFVALHGESRRLARDAEAALAAVPRWETADRKGPAWQRQDRARVLAGEAARALARAETAFMRALGRVEHHRRARKGLAALYFLQFEEAEAAGETDRMAHYLEMARAYDDGDLALELADEGEVRVVSDAETLRVFLGRYEPRGPLLELGPLRELGQTPTLSVRLASGSYRVVARAGDGREVRYPLFVTRANRHTVSLRVPRHGELPSGMVLVPGGPLGAGRDAERLPDFAIGKFPVTFGEYVAFLESLPAHERARRFEAESLVRDADGTWRLTEFCVEGDGRRRIEGRELHVPAQAVTWYDAQAYVEWLSAMSGLPYRLPTDLEWEKAMRGADARPFPMGTRMDPSFAKLRESRPEASQPEPVGAFPLDESPCGARDMAGGVGDWTSTMTDGRAPPRLEEEGTGADDREAVWRGGTWSTTSIDRSSLRYTQMLHHRVGWVGFRVALSLDARGSSDLVVEPMKRRA